MKRVSTYIVFIILFGVCITAFWVWQKYFENTKPQYETEIVVRGEIEEVVKARGEVVSEKEFALGFPFSGTIRTIFVKDGEKVKQGDQLMRLDTRDLEIEKSKYASAILQARLNLEKLKRGYTQEDLNVVSARVSSARTAVDSGFKTLKNANMDAYAKLADNIRTKLDSMFVNPKTEPELTFSILNQQLSIDIQSIRKSFETTLTNWNPNVSDADIEAQSVRLQEHLQLMDRFTEKLGIALNDLAPNEKVSQTSIDTWRANVSASRNTNAVAISTLTSAIEKYKVATAALKVAEEEQKAMQAGTRQEDVQIAELKIEEAQSGLDSVIEKISKATLLAPYDAVVTKIHYSSGEMFSLGLPAITVSLNAQKIQSDISELDIGKIKEEDNTVRIELDAFPGEIFSGKVTMIESMPIKDGTDKYFRANIFFSQGTSTVRIRPGMSADVYITTSRKSSALIIPEIAVTKREDKKFVSIIKEDQTVHEVEVKTGISDGDNIEVLSGIKEGDKVVILEN